MNLKIELSTKEKDKKIDIVNQRVKVLFDDYDVLKYDIATSTLLGIFVPIIGLIVLFTTMHHELKNISNIQVIYNISIPLIVLLVTVIYGLLQGFISYIFSNKNSNYEIMRNILNEIYEIGYEYYIDGALNTTNQEKFEKIVLSSTKPIGIYLSIELILERYSPFLKKLKIKNIMHFNVSFFTNNISKAAILTVIYFVILMLSDTNCLKLLWGIIILVLNIFIVTPIIEKDFLCNFGFFIFFALLILYFVAGFKNYNGEIIKLCNYLYSSLAIGKIYLDYKDSK